MFFFLALCFWFFSEARVRLTPAEKSSLKKANSLKKVFHTLGNQPFFVIVPCKSRLNSKISLNGTRITLTQAGNDGWDFSICSASTPERFLQYEQEMHAVFERLVSVLVASSSLDDQDPSSSNLSQEITSIAMDMFYYWVNFAPLSRGTSATGYASLYACILAAGFEFSEHIPKNKQLDWEAILSATPDQFAVRVSPWLRPQQRVAWKDPSSAVDIPQVDHVFTTMSEIVQVLTKVSSSEI